MKKIKLFDIKLDKKDLDIALKTIKSKFWASGAGAGIVGQFESEFQKYVGSNSSIAVNSGTAALHLALSLFNIKNKEVILPSLSFVSTAHAVVYNGGIPKFVDVDPNTMCIDPKEVQKSITHKTKLILPVHFGGTPCDLTSLVEICDKNSLFLVEDAAHAVGADYNNKKIGSHGHAVCFSFHPSKNLPMPSGGLITLNKTNSNESEIKLKSLRWCGISNRKDTYYDVDEIGWNYYMNEISASLGLCQLLKLEKNNLKRKKIAKRYSKELDVESKMPYDHNSSYHFFWILIKNRTEFMMNMKKHGIEVGTHYRPIHSFNLYRTKNVLKVTEKVGNQIVTIPCHQNLKQNDIDKIIRLVNKYSK